MSEHFKVTKEKLPETLADIWEACDGFLITHGFAEKGKAASFQRGVEAGRELRKLVLRHLAEIYKADKVEVSWPNPNELTIWRKE